MFKDIKQTSMHDLFNNISGPLFIFNDICVIYFKNKPESFWLTEGWVVFEDRAWMNLQLLIVYNL